MATELTPIDVRHLPELAHLVEEVRATRKPRRIVRDDEEVAVLMPAPKPVRQRQTRLRPQGQSVTDQTAGALKAYRLPRPLTSQEEKDAFERGVAEQVMESMGG